MSVVQLFWALRGPGVLEGVSAIFHHKMSRKELELARWRDFGLGFAMKQAFFSFGPFKEILVIFPLK